MNTHKPRTRSEKTETQPKIVVRKAETNLRFSARPETETTFTKGLRRFSAKNKNSLRQPHTTIVDSLQLPSPGGAGRGEDGPIFSGETPFPTRVSPEFYFTARCNRFSLKAFHNISDKVKFLSHHARPTLPSRVARAAHTEDPVGLPSTAAPIS